MKRSGKTGSLDRPARSFARPGYGQLYVAAVVTLGAAAIVDCAVRLVREPVPASWLVLAALTWISGSFALKVPQVPASISVSETFVFMLLLLFGGPPATLTVAVDGLLTSAMRQERQVRRLLFNIAEPAISTWLAWHAFAWAAGPAPLIGAPNTLGALVLPMLLMTSVYFLMNSWLTAFAVATDTGLTPFTIWRTHFVGVSLSYFAGASVALLVALQTREASWSSFGAVIPLVVLLYATFSGRIRRSEDANRHLAELNRLHLSTVESLAMAIDAKDQVTHGHIRRVQAQAVELGRRLGLCGEREIKALEAAALLHDMGKLSVPDYILNKPGKLTPPEYERVKQHAVVGAEILSAVEFPYPVVPIVRHHHENWDGSGYPDGLSGDSIPIGARILAVVDCYDALTSDRPYRRALSPADAIEIIEARRGREYDPIVVDAFIAFQRTIVESRAASATDAAATPPREAVAQPGDPQPAADPAHPSARSDLVATEVVVDAWSLASFHGEHLASADLLELVARRVRRLTPAALVLAFRADVASQSLVIAHASGTGENEVAGLRLPFGRGTAGWVAANQVPVVNGDPTLDTETRLQAIAPRLESSLTLPLLSGQTLIGVVTCYASGRNLFTEQHRQTVDTLFAAIAPALERNWNAMARTLPDLPAATRPADLSGGRSVAVIVALAQPSRDTDFRAGADSDLSGLAESAAWRAVRATDLVVRGADESTLLLLANVDAESGREIVERLRAEFDALSDGATLDVGLAIAPHDGSSLDALTATAHARARSNRQATAAVFASVSTERGGRFSV